MSLILEALRKMEQERVNRRGAAKELRPEVLRYRGVRQPARSSYALPLLAGGLLLACGIGAGFWLKGGSGPALPREAALDVPGNPAPAAVTVAPATSVPAPAPVQPAAPASPAASAVGPAAAPGAPRAAKTVANPAPQALPAATAVAPGTSAEPERAGAAAKALPKSKAAATSRAAQASGSAAPTGAPPADILLSGIAWQDERGLRRAVLNGALVGEGAEVAGARVLEIREDRVRMSRSGSAFEVLLSTAQH